MRATNTALALEDARASCCALDPGRNFVPSLQVLTPPPAFFETGATLLAMTRTRVRSTAASFSAMKAPFLSHRRSHSRSAAPRPRSTSDSCGGPCLRLRACKRASISAETACWWSLSGLIYHTLSLTIFTPIGRPRDCHARRCLAFKSLLHVRVHLTPLFRP